MTIELASSYNINMLGDNIFQVHKWAIEREHRHSKVTKHVKISSKVCCRDIRITHLIKIINRNQPSVNKAISNIYRKQLLVNSSSRSNL